MKKNGRDVRDETGEYWFVMDGRAVFDTDAACVLESCGPYRPSDKTLRRDWGEVDSCLCVQRDGAIEFVARIGPNVEDVQRARARK